MSNNIPLKQQSHKHENQPSSGGGGGRKTSTLKPPDQTLKCPRCDSTNTKFCYYNNYNLTQPRHFCKTCRRYWTKGGALRNIPIGGGCRKNKKTTKSCGSKFIIGDSSTSDNNIIGGLKLLDTTLSPPVMDFQLYPSRINQFSSSYGENTTPSNNLPFMNLDPLGFNFTYTNLHHGSSSLTSSIESLSSLNQDLHWKLQQQRLAMMFGGGNCGSGGGGGGGGGGENHHQNESGLQPILFQNLEIPRKDGGSGSGSGNGGVGGLATECFFHSSYAPVNVNNIPATGGNDEHGSINNNWHGVDQGWNHMNHQFNAIP